MQSDKNDKQTSVLIHDPSLQVFVADNYRIEIHRGSNPVLPGDVAKALESMK